jgi:hypothetical protein
MCQFRKQVTNDIESMVDFVARCHDNEYISVGFEIFNCTARFSTVVSLMLSITTRRNLTNHKLLLSCK